MYSPFGRQHKEDAARHWKTGFIHSVHGRHAFAVGSYAKAMKRSAQAEESEQANIAWRREQPYAAYASDCLIEDVQAAFNQAFGYNGRA